MEKITPFLCEVKHNVRRFFFCCQNKRHWLKTHKSRAHKTIWNIKFEIQYYRNSEMLFYMLLKLKIIA